jgi:hypothetical protein
LNRASKIGRLLFVGLFASVLLLLFVKGSARDTSFVQLTLIFILCVIATGLCRTNEKVFSNLGLLQLFLSALLMYTLIAVVVQIWTNNNVASADIIKNTNDTLFHALKDTGISAVHSIYLLLAVPFATLLTEKIYTFSQTAYYFILGEKKPKFLKSTAHTSNGASRFPKSFWTSFAKGFARMTFSFHDVARYLIIVFSLSFLSITLLSYFQLPPTLPENIPEPAEPYWIFMDTVVAGAVWTMYLLRKSGLARIERFYLRFFFSFLIVGVSALATILAPGRLQLLTLSLPPITLLGITLCMFSLREMATALLGNSFWRKLCYFLVGATLAVVPSVILTYSPWANYNGWAIYLWSSAAVGISIYTYLLSRYVKQRNPRVIALIIFAAFETGYLVRLFQIDLLAQSVIPWGHLLWIPSLVLGVTGAIFWKQHASASTLLMAMGLVAYVLFSGTWFYALALLHCIALSYLWTR